MSGMNLTEFLLARIDEDERFARDAGAGEWESWNRSWDDGATRDLAANGARLAELPITLDEHICRWHPARVLAECAAKRAIIDEHAYDGTQSCQSCTDTQPWWAWPCATLKLLALPHRDHPDFDPSWRVDLGEKP